ncbi:transcriptional regulator [Halomonas sp. TRM85114]|uniref:helix-turn-helix domain-containing transcriptional regulator n=1 Tax=Halomonas jincaotanensis TaxID=2810616 RepID=UPI001BD4CFBA|nr:transcriptional regulator [Halomonas jincaotanensis]MBS9402429.1 transcriptional regulator [Halomonas jincaotanensis]
MALTRDFKSTIIERVQRDPEFAKVMLDEAVTLFLNGEADTARLMLRDLVNATIGFEALADATGRPSKSLQRMLSASGNPGMDNLAAILGAVRKTLKVDFEVHAVQVA